MHLPIKKLKHEKISISPKPEHISPTTSTNCFPKINHFVVVNNANMTQIMMRITPFCSLLPFFLFSSRRPPKCPESQTSFRAYVTLINSRIGRKYPSSTGVPRAYLSPVPVTTTPFIGSSGAQFFFRKGRAFILFFRRDENHEGVRETKDEKVISTTFVAQY